MPVNMEPTAVYAKLLEGLEKNGDMPDHERDMLTFLALTCLFAMVMPLPTQVDELKRNNIILWINTHPRATSAITTAAILVAMFIHQIAPWVVEHLGMLIGLKLP